VLKQETKMNPPFLGQVQFENQTTKFPAITLDGDSGTITLGGMVKGFVLAGQTPDGSNSQISLFDKLGNETVKISAVGGILLPSLSAGPAKASVQVGGAGANGEISAISFDGKSSITLEADTGRVQAHGANSEVALFASSPDKAIPRGATVALRSDGSVNAGGSGVDGLILLNVASGKGAIRLDAKASSIALKNDAGTDTIELDGKTGNITVGKEAIRLDAKASSIALKNDVGTDTIELDGKTGNITVHGDIFVNGADFAEEFDLAGSNSPEPGTVMVIGQDGALRQSDAPYDKSVAGVISGAGGYRPGIVLDRQHSDDHRAPVALVGKVYCKVDAQYSPVAVGDLLTTSATAGHAMKVGDPLRAFGAIIGKALRPLEQGQALIPILIALQ
jgi:phosphotransferase system IIA component